MFVHVFSFNWKNGTQSYLIDRAAADIRRFAGVIPGLLGVWLGDNVSPKSAAYSTTGVMAFEDRAAFVAYEVHPAHQQLLAWLVPHIDALEFDFDAGAARLPGSG